MKIHPRIWGRVAFAYGCAYTFALVGAWRVFGGA